jgi:hypothetical protein
MATTKYTRRRVPYAKSRVTDHLPRMERSSLPRTAWARANRKVDTQPEVLLRAELHRLGYRFFKDAALRLPDRRVRVDILFPGSPRPLPSRERAPLQQPVHGRRWDLHQDRRARRGAAHHLPAIDGGNRRVSDKLPPPSREHFETFVRSILSVPKATVDRMAAERHKKRTPKDATKRTGERVDGSP